MEDKRGVSPLVATIILISMVLIISAIIFAWARSMVREDATKFNRNIRLVCEDVSFRATYSGGTLNVINEGNVPVYRIKVKKEEGANYVTEDITTMSARWPESGLNPGGAFSDNIASTIGTADRITIIPVLVGDVGNKQTIYVCEDRFGYEIEL
jgi:flagellin-like protein